MLCTICKTLKVICPRGVFVWPEEGSNTPWTYPDRWKEEEEVAFIFCSLPPHNVLIFFSFFSGFLPAFSGGETIKGISQQSGARIELQRNPPPNSDPNIKMFTVRGSPQQIDYARQLVEEKIGVNQDYLTLFSWVPLPSGLYRLTINLWIFALLGTCHSHGWPTRSPWTTWRPRTTWSPRTTRSPRSPYGAIQPWTIQPGTPRTTVSTVALWEYLHSDADLVGWQWLINYFIFFLSNQRAPCALPATRLGQWLPTLATGTTWPKWVYAVGWGEIQPS